VLRLCLEIGEGKGGAMQQWEYLQVTFSHSRRVGDEREHPWRDSLGRKGVASSHVSNIDYATLLNQLGAEGWELVGNWERAIIFKRPKQ
jgi:hypothetical protein